MFLHIFEAHKESGIFFGENRDFWDENKRFKTVN